MLSDTQLIESFIEDSIRSREPLLANKALMAECRFGSNQLLGKQTGLLAKVDIREQPLQFLIRQGTPFQGLLDEALQRHQFIGTGKTNTDGFLSYEYLPVKAGYTLNRQPARALWKNWRTLYRMQENLDKAQKLMVKNGHDWEAIQKITMSNQMMFIETASGETVSHMDDAIAWLSEAQAAATVPAPPPLPTNRRIHPNTSQDTGFPEDAF